MNFPILRKGDTVDIVVPATCCTKSQISEIKYFLTDELNLMPRILLQKQTVPTKIQNLENGFPSYDAKYRFEQLYEALKSPTSTIVWCAKGGYGSGDLLPFLAKAKKIKQEKIFIGFSDICSVGSFLQDRWGWKVLCAPFLFQLGKGDIKKSAEDELKAMLFGEKKEFTYELTALNQAKKEINKAKITGGCLSVLSGHFGTKFQIDYSGKILFLEDEGEEGERLDRYFRQLADMFAYGRKALPKAILLGNFMESSKYGTPSRKNVELAITRFVDHLENRKIKTPVFIVKDLDLGHSKKMRPLLLGHNTKITFSPTLQLKYEI